MNETFYQLLDIMCRVK